MSVASSMSIEHWSVSASWVFKDVEYTVSVDMRDDVLVVLVEDKLTADQWSGQFEAKREQIHLVCKLKTPYSNHINKYTMLSYIQFGIQLRMKWVDVDEQ